MTIVHTSLEKKSAVLYYSSYQGVLSVLNTLRGKSKMLYLLTEADEDDKVPYFFDEDDYLEKAEYFKEMTGFFEEIGRPEDKLNFPDKVPEYKILNKYCFGKYGHYFLVEGIDLSAAYTIAQVIRNNNALIIIFSSDPGISWIEKFLKSDGAGAGRSMESCFLNNQEEIIGRFDFSLFSYLPDWDCDNNTLIVSKNQELLKGLSMNTENGNVWKKLKMSMFPTISLKKK